MDVRSPPEQVTPFVARFGLVVEENLGADEYRRRWLGDRDRDARGYGFYRIAVARTSSQRPNWRRIDRSVLVEG